MIFVYFSLVVVTILMLLHWLVYHTATVFLNIKQWPSLPTIRLVFWLLGISFLPASLLTSRFYNWFTRIFYIISATWVGLFLYLLLASAAAWIIFYVFHPWLNFSMSTVMAVLMALAVVTSIYGVINAAYPRVTSVNVSIANLPESWKGKTAVWVSDVHLGQVRADGYAKNLVAKINSLRPDMVFVGGDLYDGVATNYEGQAKILSQMRAPWGLYFITGNHEEFVDDYNSNRYVQALQSAGVRVLNNEKIDIHGVQVIGVDYRSTENRQNFQNTLNQLHINKSQSSILLKHVPLNLDISEQAGISFQISGHAHHGQVWPGSLLTNLIFKGYDFGLKKYGQMGIYVSSGVGTWGPPLRVGTKPEILFIKFQ